MKQLKKIASWSAFPSLLLFVVFLVINSIITGGLSSYFFHSFIGFI